MPEPYRVEVADRGSVCPICQHGQEWDIIGPGEVAQSQTWGDLEEAEYICGLLNIAHQQGRVQYAQETVERLTKEIEDNAKPQEVAPIEPPPPFSTTTANGDDIPF